VKEKLLREGSLRFAGNAQNGSTSTQKKSDGSYAVRTYGAPPMAMAATDTHPETPVQTFALSFDNPFSDSFTRP
jgi:hypothetical protein